MRTPAPWTMKLCPCGHKACNKYLVSPPNIDGRFEKEDAELIVAAPALLEKLQKLVTDLNELIGNSDGVAGLHRNGDIAPWEDLTEGVTLSGWLASLNDARELVSRLQETQSAPTSG